MFNVYIPYVLCTYLVKQKQSGQEFLQTYQFTLVNTFRVFKMQNFFQFCLKIHRLDLITFFLLFFRDEMRNTFNLLLISMIAFDSWYLLGSILENFRRNFGLGSQLHTILFPKFLYPAMSVAMSGSIFMTVAISLERYFAVHHPIGNKINTILSSVEEKSTYSRDNFCQASVFILWDIWKIFVELYFFH